MGIVASSLKQQDDKQWLRMADLVEATGVPKSTILFYVAEGLLPEPERPKRNVAKYDPICIDLIRYIRGAQAMHRYPLSLIRSNVKHILAGASADEILQIGRRALGEARSVLYTRAQVEGLTGIDGAALDELIDLQLIWPTSAGDFDEYDLKMVELFGRAAEVGIPAGSFVGVADAIRGVEEAAAKIVNDHLSVAYGTQQASVLMDVIGRMQPHLVRRFFEHRQL
jgi:DNA-binding transcriptional MerR regulator